MSDSVRPHRWQPTRLPHPWDSPGKNTGVGCHFLLQCMKVKSEREVAQSCLTLSDPMDCLPLNSITSHFFVRCWIYFFTVFLHCQSQSGDDLTTFMSSGLLLLKHANYNLHGLKNQALKLVGTGFKVELNGDLKKPCDICGYYWSPFCAISFVIIF